MKIKKGLLSTEIEFTKEELLDVNFIKKVKKEIIGTKKLTTVKDIVSFLKRHYLLK